MDEENLQEIWQKEPLAALRWICPGELLEWGEKKDFLTQKKMQEHLLGMQGLKNAGGTQMKTMLKELCLEAKEEKTI